MLRAYLFLAVFTPLTFLFAASSIFWSLFDASGGFYAAHARLWAKISLLLAGTGVKLNGAELIPEGPAIFMSNHQSNFDVLALLAAVPCQIHWIAKKELFDIPVFGRSMRNGGYIPLDRGDGRKALESIEKAAEAVRSGKSVVIFPEGTRSSDSRLLPFRRGGFILALRAGVPVVPVTINGSGRINPANRIRIYPGEITMTIHRPVVPEYSLRRHEAEARLMEDVRRSIDSAMEI